MDFGSRLMWATGPALLLSACASPFAQPLTYKTKAVDAAGSITLSDPKLYTREMLVSERGDEVKWINQLLQDSQDPTKVKFTADLVRETEQVSAFAASLGLKFDPAAALTYRRAKETGDVQQQIDVLKLQIQLEQLKRDAEILSAARADQTTPVNADLGKLGTGSVGAATSSVSAPSLSDLKSSIDTALSALQGRLDKAGVAPAEAGLSANPIDDFRDRTAYRDMLKSARNAASLDESHDANTGRLFRLNFQAMVQPDPALPRSLGAIQMKLSPGSDAAASQYFFEQWLEYENLNADNRTAAKGFPADGTMMALVATGYFDIDSTFGAPILLPRLQDRAAQAFSLQQLKNESHWSDDRIWIDETVYPNVASILSTSAKREALVAGLCLDQTAATKALQTDVSLVRSYAQYARFRIQSYRYQALSRTYALQLGLSPAAIQADVVTRYRRALEFEQSLRDVLGPQQACKSLLAERSAAFPWLLVARGGFGLTGTDAHIYDVGPREQVERVSTVARAANSVALAATLAASDPGSGAAVDAAAGYSRQAMGRAAAMERVPNLVGYSLAGNQTFGWVVGPRATIDARGKVKMRQLLKAYDLTVDLSVPNWWGALNLEVQTIWAPTPAALVKGTLRPVAKIPESEGRQEGSSQATTQLGGGQDEPSSYTVSVPLPHRQADFALLTDAILAKGNRGVRILSTSGVVNACDKIALLVRGRNIWRARDVYVLGRKVDAADISILTDQDGIEVGVGPLSVKPELIDATTGPMVEVVTPFGSDRHAILYKGEPSGDACKPAKAEPADDPTALKIGTIETPLDFFVPGIITITLNGSNLDKIASATLHEMGGVLTLGEANKWLTIVFDATRSTIPPGDALLLTFFDKDHKSVGTRSVRIRRGSGG